MVNLVCVAEMQYLCRKSWTAFTSIYGLGNSILKKLFNEVNNI